MAVRGGIGRALLSARAVRGALVMSLLTPNKRSRAINALLRGLGVDMASHSYVSFFGWTLQRLDEGGSARRVHDFLGRALEAFPERIYLGYASERTTPVRATSLDEFQRALRRPSHLDPSSGGTEIGTRRQGFSMGVSWSGAAEAPFSHVAGVVAERWFDDVRFCRRFGEFLGGLAQVLQSEYLFASHAADEAAKMRVPKGIQRRIAAGELGNIPRYGVKPARYIPFVPWLMVLGPRYVRFFSRRTLESLPCPRKEWLPSGGLLLATDETPLRYGTDQVVALEESIRTTLGDVFFDPSDPYRIPDGPDYPVVYRKWLHDLEERWRNQPARVEDAYVRSHGVEVIERTAKKVAR